MKNEISQRITIMELKEKELIDKLRHTKSKQIEANRALENMASMGHQYFQQCKKLKFTRNPKMTLPTLEGSKSTGFIEK